MFISDDKRKLILTCIQRSNFLVGARACPRPRLLAFGDGRFPCPRPYGRTQVGMRLLLTSWRIRSDIGVVAIPYFKDHANITAPTMITISPTMNRIPAGWPKLIVQPIPKRFLTKMEGLSRLK